MSLRARTHCVPWECTANCAATAMLRTPAQDSGSFSTARINLGKPQSTGTTACVSRQKIEFINIFASKRENPNGRAAPKSHDVEQRQKSFIYKLYTHSVVIQQNAIENKLWNGKYFIFFFISASIHSPICSPDATQFRFVCDSICFALLRFGDLLTNANLL